MAEPQEKQESEQSTDHPDNVWEFIKSTGRTVADWYRRGNDNYGLLERPRTWLVTGLTAAALTVAAHKANDLIVEESTYQGTVTSFGRSGWVLDTYQGTFAIGGDDRSKDGYFGLDEQARNGEDIEALAVKLYEAVETGKRVRVTGKKPLFAWPWRSGMGSYHVQTVEFIDE